MLERSTVSRPQRTGADGLKPTLGELYEDRAKFFNVRAISAMHDEIVIEVPEEETNEVTVWSRQHMQKPMSRVVQGKVPIVVDHTIGKAN